MHRSDKSMEGESDKDLDPGERREKDFQALAQVPMIAFLCWTDTGCSLHGLQILPMLGTLFIGHIVG